MTRWCPSLSPTPRILVHQGGGMESRESGLHESSSDRHLAAMKTAQVLAAQTLKIANMNGIAELDRLENELEDEINWESQSPPREFLARARQQVHKVLHTKAVLLLVVVLNVLDCILVLGEIAIDFHYTSRSENLLKNASKVFVKKMASEFPIVLETWSVYNLYDHLLHASLLAWDATGAQQACLQLNVSNDSSHGSDTVLDRHRRAAKPAGVKDYSDLWQTKDYDTSMKLMYDVAHALHLASITILSILVAETLVKIIATVPRFFRSKLQVFDAIVVFISFIVDLVFIEGLLSMESDTFVWAVTILLPWRIVRVLNSLVVAVMDKQRFHLKLMYKQKKKLEKTLQDVNSKSSGFQKQLNVLKQLCKTKGIPEWEVAKALGDQGAGRSDSSGGLAALGKLAVKAMGAFTPVPRPYSPTPDWSRASKSRRLCRRQSLSTPNLIQDSPTSPSFLTPALETDFTSTPDLTSAPPRPANEGLPPAPKLEDPPGAPIEANASPARNLRLYIAHGSSCMPDVSSESGLGGDSFSCPSPSFNTEPSFNLEPSYMELINEESSVSRL